MLINSVKVFANAKINLTLDIESKRADGYHEISSVMQSVGIFDTITIARSDRIDVSCTDAALDGEQNLAHRAAALFFAAAKICGGAKINIEKRIPVAAGLGGGSADAAAVITGLDALFNTGFSREVLCRIGLSAGADVPFCIAGGTLLSQGVGEKLTTVAPIPDCFIVIVKQGEKSSTGALYSQYDKAGVAVKKGTPAMLAALAAGKIEAVGARLCNAFEPLVPQSAKVKRIMLENGALGAALSGSGPSVFSIFADKTGAGNCAALFGGSAYICRPRKRGCRIYHNNE